MNLSDNEKRDIVKFIEAGKPLPDKYRFLLFEDNREVELVWNGKTNEVTNVVLPFQTIEQVDEPRSEKEIKMQRSLFDIDSRGRQLKGWTNKLVWGDNKLVISSLKNGPMREEIEKQGGIKLIYIDPPFSAGIDYSINVEIGGDDNNSENFVKSPSVLEEFAYRNTWGNGGNTFLSMLSERVFLMKDLLARDGIFFLRIDHHWGHYVKVMLDEIFGKEFFQSEIVVNRTKKNVTNQGKLSLPVSNDSFFVYFKSAESKFVHINTNLKEERAGYWRRTDDSAGERRPRERFLFGKIFNPPAGNHFKFSQDRMEEMIKLGKLRYNERIGRLEYWVEASNTKILDTNWTDISGYSFTTGYPTENAEILLERVIDIATKDDDLIADFFCGSGTTLACAEKLGRKWIGSDLGKFAIHTTRKRMIGVQRQMKKKGKNFRAFEILNLGKYERQHYIGVNPNLRDEEKQAQIAQKEKEFVSLVLSAYKAEAFDGFRTFHGKKSSRLVAIGPINLPVSRLFVEEVINECQEKKITKADILAFEFEMGLFPNIQEEAKSKGIDLALKYIPRDVFDKRAIEKNQVVFHDVSYIEVKPIIKKNTLAIELTDFSVFYNQDSIKEVEENLKNGGKKLIVENGRIIKISKDKDGITTREVLTKEWTDWIDYWAVDFDFESKKEIIRVAKKEQRSPSPRSGQISSFEEIWTGDYIFENEWQSFRTKKDRSLELISVAKEMRAGKHKVAIKVVDIFGNDTMKIIEIKI
jgi:hypothetical protein